MDTTDRTFDLQEARFGAPETTTPAKPRAARRGFKILLGGVAFLTLLAASGAAYEAIASRSDATTYPPPGRLIDVGGHRMHLNCEGTGKPAVILDAGLGGSSPVWSLVQPKLAQSTEVCSFDRAGMGWSEPGPLPRTPARNAAELHQLLEAGGVEGPYILVGHSLAGKNDRLFASAYPDEVAGLVLVDARSETLDIGATEEEVAGFRSALDLQATLYTVARRLGLVRLLGASLAGSPLLAPETSVQLALFETATEAIATTTEEGGERRHDDALLAASSLGNLPLVVIAASDSMANSPGWPDAQDGLAALSSRGRLVMAEHSSHAIHLDQPDIVIDAALSVLADARKRN
jgi:pimeloyl-ACP methyl ester carboxylesterase